ncbi:hypothetical protein DFR76_101231 [Nocardia pseudobrasiliensis]|uniref:Uncharacterized protein n=1 Tax=Nocardia pseudobrasiliensis TaxID=45979 RepID=A0A370IDA5_9NOCA|nr:hypothetical protein DFR76_101231 [Nocardia pseudobrasiliensis]
MGSFNVGDWMTVLGHAFTWVMSMLVSGSSSGSTG